MKFRSLIYIMGIGCAGFIGVGCSTSPPNGIEPVTGFESKKYLGTWYEIARLDHFFERGLRNVTATYSENEDGTIKVQNRGYNEQKEAWETIEGKARLRGEPDVGSLEVSFFGPFYGGYHIFVLDEDYQYAMVAGPSRDYLWILSRTPTIDESTYQGLMDEAEAVNFNTDALIVVDHSDPLEE